MAAAVDKKTYFVVRKEAYIKDINLARGAPLDWVGTPCFEMNEPSGK